MAEKENIEARICMGQIEERILVASPLSTRGAPVKASLVQVRNAITAPLWPIGTSRLNGAICAIGRHTGYNQSAVNQTKHSHPSHSLIEPITIHPADERVELINASRNRARHSYNTVRSLRSGHTERAPRNSGYYS